MVMEQDDRRLRPASSSKNLAWNITLAQLCVRDCSSSTACGDVRDQSRLQRRKTDAEPPDPDNFHKGVWISSSSQEATVVVSPPTGEDAECGSSSFSTVSVILNGRTHEHHRLADVSIAWPQVACTGEHKSGRCGSCVLLASYRKIPEPEGNSKISTNDQNLSCSKFAMRFGAASEAEECFRFIQKLVTAETSVGSNPLDTFRMSQLHNSGITSKDFHGTQNAPQSHIKEKAEEPQLPSFPAYEQNHSPACFSPASHDQCENMRRSSQEEPRFCSQVSGMTSTSSLKRKIRGDPISAERPGSSTGIRPLASEVLESRDAVSITGAMRRSSQEEPRFCSQVSGRTSISSLKRKLRGDQVSAERPGSSTDIRPLASEVPESRDAVSNTGATGEDGENENLANLTVNLDSSSQLWSQYSPLLSQAFQTDFSQSFSEKNPKVGKKPPVVRTLANEYRDRGKRTSSKRAAIETTQIVSQRASREPFSNREEIRVDEDGEGLVEVGVGTNPQQLSSQLNFFQGPPRFSQLLTQASQSKQRTTLDATQTPNRGFQKRKSNAGGSVQDDHQGAPFRETNLREQVLACLLDPDFEAFVAEVEKVWDDLENEAEREGASLGSRLQQGTGYGRSQNR